jgi:hypothetical protein
METERKGGKLGKENEMRIGNEAKKNCEREGQ